MYQTVLTLHSWNRWFSLLLGLAATISAFVEVPATQAATPPGPGRAGKRRSGSRWDTFFMASVDLQMLFGLLLYFGLSPFTTEALNNLSSAMRSPALRFWTVEHVAGMFAAVVLVRLGRIFAMTAATAEAKRSRRLVCFALALVLMVAAIPWPGLAQGRPLLRGWPGM